MTSFIDDIIVVMEEEEEHYEIMKELMKRLAENNLYLKLEKYKWKIRKIRLLEVVYYI